MHECDVSIPEGEVESSSDEDDDDDEDQDDDDDENEGYDDEDDMTVVDAHEDTKKLEIDATDPEIVTLLEEVVLQETHNNNPAIEETASQVGVLIIFSDFRDQSMNDRMISVHKQHGLWGLSEMQHVPQKRFSAHPYPEKHSPCSMHALVCDQFRGRIFFFQLTVPQTTRRVLGWKSA